MGDDNAAVTAFAILCLRGLSTVGKAIRRMVVVKQHREGNLAEGGLKEKDELTSPLKRCAVCTVKNSVRKAFYHSTEIKQSIA